MWLRTFFRINTSLMSNQGEHLSLVPSGADMAPVAAIGGLLAAERNWPLYARMLSSGAPSEVSVQDRFFAIREQGRGDPYEAAEELGSQLMALYEQLDERLVVVGHSMGALMGTMVAVEHPEIIAGVVCLAGAQEGIKQETPFSFALRHALGNPETAAMIQHDSGFMQEHRQRMATEWSADTSLHLISPTIDGLLVLPQGLGIELPKGQQPQRRVVCAPIPGMRHLLRAIPDMPQDVEILPSLLPAGHIEIPMSGPVIKYTESVRRAAVMEPEGVPLSLPIAPSAHEFAIAA
jgi:pimeloyl-ACP methyl ester carboxylesterase